MTDQVSLNVPQEQPMSPEDDAALQAIEAIEAKSIDPDPKPLMSTRPAMRPIAPITVPKVEPTTQSVVPPKALVIPPTPPSKPVDVPKLPVTPKHRPANPAEAIAEELANAPPTSLADAPFQPFPKYKPSKKHLIIALIAVGIILTLAITGYLLLRSA